MADFCGEEMPATHRCGDCGDEPVYGIADLEALHVQFTASDWPGKEDTQTFFDWVRSIQRLLATEGAPHA